MTVIDVTARASHHLSRPRPLLQGIRTPRATTFHAAHQHSGRNSASRASSRQVQILVPATSGFSHTIPRLAPDIRASKVRASNFTASPHPPLVLIGSYCRAADVAGVAAKTARPGLPEDTLSVAYTCAKY